jgi:Immunity protein 40
MDMKTLLSDSLFSRAYEFNSEFAWRPEDLPAIAESLRANQVPILGGEVWIKTDSGPMIPSDVYQWSVEKRGDETSGEFANRSVGEMLKFGESLHSESTLKENWPNVYINLQVAEVK